MFYWDISSMNFRENKNENKKNMFSFSKETQSIGCNYKNRFYEKKKKKLCWRHTIDVECHMQTIKEHSRRPDVRINPVTDRIEVKFGPLNPIFSLTRQ